MRCGSGGAASYVMFESCQAICGALIPQQKAEFIVRMSLFLSAFHAVTTSFRRGPVDSLLKPPRICKIGRTESSGAQQSFLSLQSHFAITSLGSDQRGQYLTARNGTGSDTIPRLTPSLHR